MRKAQLRKDSFRRNRASAKPSPSALTDCKAWGGRKSLWVDDFAMT
jgi:hypothetical protein